MATSIYDDSKVTTLSANVKCRQAEVKLIAFRSNTSHWISLNIYNLRKMGNFACHHNHYLMFYLNMELQSHNYSQR